VGGGGEALPLTGKDAPLVSVSVVFDDVALRAGLAPASCSAPANVDLPAPGVAEMGAADAPTAEPTSGITGG
jgi:hypothetical protein